MLKIYTLMALLALPQLTFGQDIPSKIKVSEAKGMDWDEKSFGLIPNGTRFKIPASIIGTMPVETSSDKEKKEVLERTEIVALTRDQEAKLMIMGVSGINRTHSVLTYKMVEKNSDGQKPSTDYLLFQIRFLIEPEKTFDDSMVVHGRCYLSANEDFKDKSKRGIDGKMLIWTQDDRKH